MNTPTLRFKEFSGEWEVKKLGDVCNKIMDGTHFSPKSTEGTRKYLTSKNIRNSGLDISVCSYISEEEHQEIYKKCPVKLGDILLTKDGANTGNCCINTLQEEFSLLSSVAVLSGKENLLNSLFLLQILQSSHGVNAINNDMAGQAITRITLEKINKFKFKFPTLPEQTKIANFLTAIDEKIAQLSQTAQLLTDYKKGVMQQIFSQQLRFKDDDGREFAEWEEKSLGEIYTNIRNGFVGIATPYYVENGIKYLQGKNIKNGSVDDKGLIYISEDFHNKSKKSQLKLNDIVMVQSGHVGECAVIDENYVNANCHALIILSPKDCKKVSSKFFVYYFHSSFGKRSIYQIKTGNTIEHILTSEMKELTVFIPSFPEQTKIANFLTAIDDKINHNQTQLDAMKQYKSGLLQQMFV